MEHPSHELATEIIREQEEVIAALVKPLKAAVKQAGKEKRNRLPVWYQEANTAIRSSGH